MRWLGLALFFLLEIAFAQNETRELIGQVGGRAALLQLYISNQPDGSARLSGDYLLLPTLQQRFLEGERSKQLGVTFLKEGNSPILYGRPATATLQGTWSGGILKGGRFGPSGQQRERFEFSETFPAMDGYSTNARCEFNADRYAGTLALAVEGGKLKSLDWRSKVAPGDQPCNLANFEQKPFAGGLRFATGKQCAVTLRDLGEFVRVTAEGCSEFCGSQGYVEPVLIYRRGNCELLRPLSR